MNLPKLRFHNISVLLGHSSIAIIDARYANRSKEQSRRALDAFNEIIK